MLDTKALQTFEVVCPLLHAEKNVRLEGDGSLPEHLDDIHRIVTSNARVTFTKKRLAEMDGKIILSLGGILTVRMIYRGEDSGEVLGLMSHNFTKEFEEEFELPSLTELPDAYHLTLRADVGSVSCRATGKKKCTFAANFTLRADVLANRALSCFSSEDESVEVLERAVETTRLVSSREESFELEEEITLPEKLPPVLSLLDSSMDVHSQWVKKNEHGATLSLLARFYCAYQSEENEDEESRLCSFVNPVEITEHLLFSEEFDADLMQVSVLPGSLKTELIADAEGAFRTLKFHFTYTVTSALYEVLPLPLVTDAYCTKGTCETRFATASLPLFGKTERVTLAEDFTLATTDAFSALENCSARLNVREITLDPQGATLSSQITFSALGMRAEDGRAVQLQETLSAPLVLKLPSVPSNLRILEQDCAVHMEPEKDGVRARLTVHFSFVCESEQKETFVSELFVSPQEESSFSGVHFYYPDEHETLWEIARTWRVSRHALMAENEMSAEAPLPKMLVIAK